MGLIGIDLRMFLLRLQQLYQLISKHLVVCAGELFRNKSSNF